MILSLKKIIIRVSGDQLFSNLLRGCEKSWECMEDMADKPPFRLAGGYADQIRPGGINN